MLSHCSFTLVNIKSILGQHLVPAGLSGYVATVISSLQLSTVQAQKTQYIESALVSTTTILGLLPQYGGS